MRSFGYEEDRVSTAVGDLQLWTKLVGFSKNHKFALTGAILLSLLITGATLGLPQLMQLGIDNFILNSDLALSERYKGLTTVSLIFLLLVFTVLISTFFQVVILEWMGQSIMHRIRQDLFSHILHLDLPFFDAKPTGRLVTRLTNDIQNMHEMFTSVLVTIFNDLLRLIGILILLLHINFKLGLLMFLFVPLAAIITKLFSKLAREQFRKIRSQLSKLNSFLAEAISGMATLQLFGRQQKSKMEYEELSGNYLKQNLRQIKLFGTFMPLTEFMSSTAIALILWYGGSEILKEQLTLGELVAFLSYMRLFFQPLRELAQKYSIIQSAMASAERIFELLDTDRDIKETKTPVSLEKVGGTICFNNVSFGYKEESPIIRNIDLHISGGQTIALVGTTGAGKTTLVNLLLRFYEPNSGKITIDGVDISSFSLKKLRQMIGVVLQDIFILQDTLLANIIMDSATTREEVEEILHHTGMSRFVEKLPDGLDTVIGEGGRQLSTGEKQLLAFTRVLCRKPSILILDEATAAIDTESENILEDALQASFSGKTSLIIAHRLSTIKRASKIVVLAHGKIVEEGTHETLTQMKGYYSELVAMDLKDS